MTKILRLFGGVGGDRLFFEKCKITSIEINPDIAKIYKKRFPDDILIVEDVIEWINNNQEELLEFDLILGSPPCQSHSKLPQNLYYFKRRIPDLTSLYGLIIFFSDRLNHPSYNSKKPITWIIENTTSWYSYPIKPTARFARHNFWSNIPLEPKEFDLNYSHQNFSFLQLCKYYNIDKNLFNHIKTDLKKRQILRNILHPEIGKYLLEQHYKHKDQKIKPNKKIQSKLSF